MSIMQLSKIKHIAAINGWELLKYSPEDKLIMFGKKIVVEPETLKEKIRAFFGKPKTIIGAKIGVYYTTMTVSTTINHPKFGVNQLFRKDVDGNELKKIFVNPRTHTGKGYRTKADKKKLNY